jgi:D-3-phosphoglycerate dehydrogenase
MATTEELRSAVAEEPTHAIISRAAPVTSEVMDASPELRVISKHGVGCDNVDLNSAINRGIAVMRTYGANSRSVSELTLALSLNLLRHVFPLDGSLRAGRWERSAYIGAELTGKEFGIVGCGAVGSDLARICRCLDVRVSIFDPYIDEASVPEGARRVPQLGALLERSDIVSLHCPLTAETQGMINADAFAVMKPSVLLVNTARGPIVDEKALIIALQTGCIAGAALDTFEQEPPGANNPLWRLPNVVFTPHVGGSTGEALRRVAVQAVENIFDVLDGREPDPQCVVTPCVEMMENRPHQSHRASRT